MLKRRYGKVKKKKSVKATPKPRKPSWGGYSYDYKAALDHMDAIAGRPSYSIRRI